MRSQRWAWTHRYGVPLFVASAVSVLLAGGALVAVVALGGGGDDGERTDLGNSPGPASPGASPEPASPGASPEPSSPGASPSLAADADCVVGRWRIVEQRQVLSSGIFTLVGDGPVVEYRRDGTGSTEFGDGVPYAITDTTFGGLGNTDTTVTGTVHHDYVVQGGTMQYVNLRSEATMTVEIIGELPYELSNEPFEFGCEGDTMTHHIEERYQSRLERLDP